MESKKTHWKKLNNPSYIGACHLDPGKDLVVTIKKVSRQIVVGEGGKGEECTIAELEGQKPMVLNVTNCKTIASLYKTPYVEEWAGKKIILYIASIQAFGETVECLRIRPKLPALLPELTPSHEKWEGAKVAIQQGSTTIEAIRKKYTLSNENASKLLPELTPSHENWYEIMTEIQQGSTTIEAIRKKYTVSNENALKLQNDAI